jgi:hypothetical protein
LKNADDPNAFERRLAAEPSPNGEFGFSFVPAGRYTIEALRRPTPEKPALAANVAVVVEPAAPRDDVEVRLAPGPRFAGRLQIATDEQSRAADLKAFAVVLIPRGPITPEAFIPRRQVADENGQFDIPMLIPGDYVVQVIGRDSQDWSAASVMVDGRDVLDSTLTMTAGRDVTDAVITLTSKRPEITGFVRTAGNVTTTDGYVIAFPTDRTLWTSQRRISGVKPDTDGRYRIAELPPGEYFVLATDAQAGQWRDTAFLATLMGRADRVTIKAGETITRDLKRPAK